MGNKKNVCNAEAWKFITWIEGIPADKYQISDTGKVFNTYTRRFISTCISNNNLNVSFNNGPTNGKKLIARSASVARLVAIAFIPIPEELDFCDYEDLVVFRKNGNPFDVSVGNLRWDISGPGYARRSFDYDTIADVLNKYKDSEISYTEITEILRAQHGIERTAASICMMYNHRLAYLDKMKHQVERRTVRMKSGRPRRNVKRGDST